METGVDEQSEKLAFALRSLALKVAECGEASKGAFQIAKLHGYEYRGPNWVEELLAAEQTLTAYDLTRSK